jgi:hypothetical protein
LRCAVGYAFLSLACRVWLVGQWLLNNDCPFPLSAVSPSRPTLTEEKKGKKLPAALEVQKKRSSTP